jgi:hypothetical protein
MCDLYGARSDERALLVQLSSDASKRGWWTAYDDALTGSYVADEAFAGREKAPSPCWTSQPKPPSLPRSTPKHRRRSVPKARSSLPALTWPLSASSR